MSAPCSCVTALAKSYGHCHHDHCYPAFKARPRCDAQAQRVLEGLAGWDASPEPAIRRHRCHRRPARLRPCTLTPGLPRRTDHGPLLRTLWRSQRDGAPESPTSALPGSSAWSCCPFPSPRFLVSVPVLFLCRVPQAKPHSVSGRGAPGRPGTHSQMPPGQRLWLLWALVSSFVP